MAKWIKVRDLPDLENFMRDSTVRDDRKPPHWLWIRRGIYKTSYRVVYRKDKVSIQEVISGDFKTWKDAVRPGEELIAAVKYGGRKKSTALVLCSELADKIVKSKTTKAESTYDGAELFFRLHIVPYLNKNCAYAANLTNDIWVGYKLKIRTDDPTVAIFNHWKYFNMLCKHAHDNGFLKIKPKLDYEESEDKPRIGFCIPKEDLQKMFNAASPDWKDRIYGGHICGPRPGELRCLQKDRADFELRMINLRAEDTKTRIARSFLVTDPAFWAILERRKLASESPFFFPSKSGTNKPMGRSNKGWKRLLARAKVNPDYIPNDLRHTFISEMIKAGMKVNDIAEYVGNSPEEIARTYKHLLPEDTRKVAVAAQSGLRLF